MFFVVRLPWQSGANRQLGVVFLYELLRGRVGLSLLGRDVTASLGAIFTRRVPLNPQLGRSFHCLRTI